MKKSKIAFIATFTALTVGVVNALGAVIAYSLVVPEPAVPPETLITQATDAPVATLPVPATTESPVEATSGPVQTSTGQKVALRKAEAKLTPGQTPSPASVTVDQSGQQVFKWCSGVNPNLPDEVCQAIISIATSPVASNPHLGDKARQSLSLLPRDTSLVMDEASWQADGASKGSMIVTATTAAYGTLRIKIFLEKQNNIWVLVDGQLA